MFSDLSYGNCSCKMFYASAFKHYFANGFSDFANEYSVMHTPVQLTTQSSNNLINTHLSSLIYSNFTTVCFSDIFICP